MTENTRTADRTIQSTARTKRQTPAPKSTLVPRLDGPRGAPSTRRRRSCPAHTSSYRRSPKRGSPRCRARVDRRFGRRSCYRGSGLDTLPQIHSRRGNRRPHRSDRCPNWPRWRNRHRAIDGQASTAPGPNRRQPQTSDGFRAGNRRCPYQTVIDRSFDLDEIADAFRYEASGQHFGKICLEF
jgi:hypothetical protein